MRSVTTYRVLIASPGDVDNLRDVAARTILRWNRENYRKGVFLLPITWELDAPPLATEDIQDYLNQKLVAQCDSVIGIFWTRLGSPTKRGEAGGAIEEIKQFEKAHRYLYLCNKPVKPNIQHQGPEVVNSLKELGLIKEFQDDENFEQILFHDLSNIVGSLPPPQEVSESKGIVAYSGERNVPADGTAEGILQLSEEGDHIVVVGRTCLRWLVGESVSQLEIKEESLRQQGLNTNQVSIYTIDLKKQVSDRKKLLQDAICNALARNVCLTFVVSDFYDDFLDPDYNRYMVHLQKSEKSFEEVVDRLKTGDRPSDIAKIKFRFSEVPITNSRVLHWGSANQLKRIHYDLAMDFINKPFTVITKSELAGSVIDESNKLVKDAISKEAFEIKRGLRNRYSAVRAEISDSWSKCSDYSKIRKNPAHRLVRRMIRWVSSSKQPPPPVSVQFLLTHICPTECAMCTHYQLGRSKTDKDLNTEEVKRLFEDIADMGTRSVVLSGGEPLMRDDLIELLTYGQALGLRFGLLTSGIAKKNSDIATLTSSIASHCSWVQVSIDSFSRDSYEGIRQKGSLERCKEFVNQLNKHGLCDIEICFTLQQRNYKEAMESDFFQRISDSIPDDIPVRFKFAHGHWGCNQKQGESISEIKSEEPFVLNSQMIRELTANWKDISALNGHASSIRNAQVLAKIVSNMDLREDIAEGLPMKNQFLKLEGNSPCHALKMSMFINSNGEIYPCCFLYNDNSFEWEHREQYRVDTWESVNRSKIVVSDNPQSEPFQNNPLERIWQSEDFQAIREKPLPVLDLACGRCTRFMHLNRFLQPIQEVFKNSAKNLNLSSQELEEIQRGLDDPPNCSESGPWL
jgi:MoaA/NifB/PqqE/SkfB family radical SAM enzyme